jgi:hypothetical protein
MTSNITIVSASKINKDNLTFVVGQAKAGRNPPINMKYDGQNFQLRLPAKIQIPSGLWVREDPQNGSKSYTLSVPLKGCDPFGRDRNNDGSEMAALYNYLLDLEDSLVQQAFENSTKWFGKKRSMEAIRDSFAKIVSVSSDVVNGERVPNGKYPPSFRVKIPVYDGSVKSDIVDGNGNPMYATPESIVSIFPKSVSASLVITGSVYTITGGSFGVTWKLTFARVYPQSKLTAKDVFKDEVADDEDEEEDAPTESQTAPPAAKLTVEIPPVDTSRLLEEEAQPEKPVVSRRKKATGGAGM